MIERLHALWGWAAGAPLFHLTMTVLVFQGCDWLFRRSGMKPWCNPVLLSVLILGGVLVLCGLDYATYYKGTQVLSFLLGPATVALALPLYRQLHHIRRSGFAILVGLVVGSATAILSGSGLARLLGAGDSVVLSLLPRAATAPIAMGISERMGGIPSLTACLVVLSGITGAMFATPLLNLLRISDPMARGFAAGLASHGIATARKLQLNETAGAFAGMAMSLNGLATAVLVPLVARLL